tara:strand:- start:14531 stop:14860 length:330 start_codon:yes stop_codon:yes gene_type:complete
MQKTYSFHIEDNKGRWKIKYESKSNASRIKGKIIKALWNEKGLTVEGIRDKIAETTTHIPSSHQLGNILRGNGLFKNEDTTTVSYLGSKCDRVMIWKLNRSYLIFEQVA